MGCYRANQLVCVDETGCIRSSWARVYGWAPSGDLLIDFFVRGIPSALPALPMSLKGSRTNEYVVLTQDNKAGDTYYYTIDGNSAQRPSVGHLKGHHTYASLGLQAPHGQIQLDTTNHIRCNIIIIPSDSVDQDGQCASIQSYIQIQESRGGCHEQKMDNERAETRGNMTGLRYYRRT